MSGWNWQIYAGERLYRGWYHVKNKAGRTCYMMLYSPERKDFTPLLRGGGWGDPGQPDVHISDLSQYILIKRERYCGPDDEIRKKEDAEWPQAETPNDFIELAD